MTQHSVWSHTSYAPLRCSYGLETEQYLSTKWCSSGGQCDMIPPHPRVGYHAFHLLLEDEKDWNGNLSLYQILSAWWSYLQEAVLMLDFQDSFLKHRQNLSTLSLPTVPDNGLSHCSCEFAGWELTYKCLFYSMFQVTFQLCSNSYGGRVFIPIYSYSTTWIKNLSVSGHVISFTLYVSVSVCIWCACTVSIWRSEDNLEESVLSTVQSRERTKAVRLNAKCLYPLSHFIGPASWLLEECKKE